MARHRSFTVPQNTEELFFDLEGQRFSCRPQIAAGVLLAFVTMGDNPAASKKKGKKAASAAEEADNKNSTRALLKFFRGALRPPEYKRFMDLINDPDIAIPLETLNDIIEWLAEEYTGRPTGGSSSPTSDSGSSGEGSTAGPSTAGQTYSRSPQTDSAT